MAASLANMPIKRKLMLAILLTSSFALLLMGVSLITYELMTFRRSLAANVQVLAQVIGSNSTAALAFQDRKSAQEVLGALTAERQISAAAIYDTKGKLFASFPAKLASSDFPLKPAADGYYFERAHLVMFQPIVQEGARLGTIFLRADLREVYSRIVVYSALLFLVAICSFIAAIPLSAGLQRRISAPILALARVASAVSERQDYSVRGDKQGADEIGQLTDAFNQMLTRIGQTTDELSKAKEAAEGANNAKDNFLAVLSHELRTPLTPVLTTIAMLEEDKSISQHVRDELDLIRRNIEVEARLIDDLLDVTGIIRGKLELHRGIVDVAGLVKHAMTNYCARTAAKKNLSVTLDASATRTHVLADSSRLTQVFWNLLQNACKFTPDGGTIDIRIYNEPHGKDPEVVVEIRDNGIGIHPDTMPRIFEPFEQGERSRTRLFGGLGLGLAISRAIVELHGGSISAQSEGQDKGTKVTIRFETVAEGVTRTDGMPSALRDVSEARHLNVLLVEDHPDTAKQLARLLERAGHRVTCAGSVREGLELARSGDFEILISDLGLPDGTGYDLMRNLQHAIPGIALSGFGMKEDVQNSIAAGFARHLTKPVDWQELKSEIQKVASPRQD